MTKQNNLDNICGHCSKEVDSIGYTSYNNIKYHHDCFWLIRDKLRIDLERYKTDETEDINGRVIKGG